MQFENHFGGLDYTSEITLGSHERDLCGDCAIDYMETKIRSQEGYIEEDDNSLDYHLSDADDADKDSDGTLGRR